MTGDGHAELIGLTTNGYVYVYDVFNQVLVWKSTGLDGGGQDLEVADIDHDGKSEIVVATGNRLYVFRRTSSGGVAYLETANAAWNPGYFYYPIDILVADTDGDGPDEIYALTGDKINVYGPALQSLGQVTLAGTATALALEESALPRKNLLVSMQASDPANYYTSNAASRIKAVDPRNGADVWESPLLNGTFGHNGLQLVDSDGDGKLEIVFAGIGGMFRTR